MASRNHDQTLYIPVVSPPTPAPSPGPSPDAHTDITAYVHHEFSSLSTPGRRQYLSAILANCSLEELLFVSTIVTPLLKRDLLRDLPPEVSVQILSYLDDPKELVRVGQVSQHWHRLASDDWLWKGLGHKYGFLTEDERDHAFSTSSIQSASYFPTYKSRFRDAFTTVSNWRRGGTLLKQIPFHSPPQRNQPPQNQLHNSQPNAIPTSSNAAIPTSLALDSDWVVVGLANSRIHVFNARNGINHRTLVGHSSGVWTVALVQGSGIHVDLTDPLFEYPPDTLGKDPEDPSLFESVPSENLRKALGMDLCPRKGGKGLPVNDLDDPMPSYWNKPSTPTGTSEGWGQPNALIVSGGCDKDVRVWDAVSGYCIYTMKGHTSTIRCLKVFHRRPIAVSGARDKTLRVWDIQHGRMLRVLEGHEQSVRCLDVCDNRVVSGSYDYTCRVWNVDTGECLHILRGHIHQIYTVAFDGTRIASGGLDTTVRIWDAQTGECNALLQGHTALVCQLQLSPTMLATGGSDGRVITFDITPSASKPFSVVQRLAAHDSSVTGLQFDDRFLVTSGNDGRVRLFEFPQGTNDGKCDYVRELCDPSENVWKLAFTRETCVIMYKRAGKTVMDLWSFRPKDSPIC